MLKQSPSPLTINLNNADTQQMNLDTRLVQLDAAIQMELWQEAYKAIEVRLTAYLFTFLKV